MSLQSIFKKVSGQMQFIIWNVFFLRSVYTKYTLFVWYGRKPVYFKLWPCRSFLNLTTPGIVFSMLCRCENSPRNDLRIDIEQNNTGSRTKNPPNLFQPKSRYQSSYAYVLAISLSYKYDVSSQHDLTSFSKKLEQF